MTPLEKLTIDTPEQVALEFDLASVGSRFLALAVDTLLQIAAFVTLGLGALLMLRFGATIGTWGLAILFVLAFLLYYGYFAAFETWWQGQTPGKRVVGLRVITVSGRPIGPYDSLLRNLLRIVDQIPAVYGLGILSVIVTSKNQRLGDLAAATVVVHERPERPIAPLPERSAAGPVVVKYGAARLTSGELVLIESFLERRADLPLEVRLSTARQIADRIRQRLEIPVEPADNEAWLEEVAAEYRSTGRYR